MHYELIPTLAQASKHCLVLGLFEDSTDLELAALTDKDQQTLLPRLFQKLHEPGDWLWQADLNGCSLMLIHCGKATEFNAQQLQKRVTDLTTALLKHRMTEATIALPPIHNQSANWQLTQMLLQIDAHCYQLMDYKTIGKKEHRLNTISFFLPQADETAIHKGKALASGIHLTRKLADLPANHCTPTFLGEEALRLAKQHSSIQTTVWQKEDLKKMGMGALLGVAQGSHEPPCLIEAHYQGNGNAPPVVLVGKGITFDAGGLSLKPPNAMDEMKYDMAGAASVLGALQACALLKLPVNVIGLIASAENMPSGSAIKPGDIITSMSGQTIEVLNTDAEGRLALADALTYAERFKPQMVLDIATLTGAIIVALGNINTGFMTNDESIAERIRQAAEQSQDKAWRLPLDETYQEALESPLADMINAGFDRSASAITAACFLSRFTNKYPWAHLDIAGTAWVSGKARRATGRPVPLLVELLAQVAHAH